MFIPSGDYIIVRRHTRFHPHSKGEVVRGGMSKEIAELKAKQYQHPEYNVWVMHKEEYYGKQPIERTN